MIIKSFDLPKTEILKYFLTSYSVVISTDSISSNEYLIKLSSGFSLYLTLPEIATIPYPFKTTPSLNYIFTRAPWTDTTFKKNKKDN